MCVDDEVGDDNTVWPTKNVPDFSVCVLRVVVCVCAGARRTWVSVAPPISEDQPCLEL